jgi:hypothetical protein
MAEQKRVIWFDRLRMSDIEQVGGKNASLGEMIARLGAEGVQVPGGFATTAAAFREFLAQTGLSERIAKALSGLDVDDVGKLAKVGAQIRGWIVETALPEALKTEIEAAYQRLSNDNPGASVAVRSSATAEDMPDASFAGQPETFLNISGLDNLIHAIREVFASLYTDRAIAYRTHQGYAETEVALSVGVQRMIRSDKGAAGVMFTLDTESGFDQVVFITASYGLGETVVQGAVNPDEFYVYKPNLVAGRPAILRKSVGAKAIKMVFAGKAGAGESVTTVDVPPAERVRFSITDAEVEQLARHALAIERHYGKAMDIEWGRDGVDGKLYILQARPETVKSQQSGGDNLRRYRLESTSKVLASGRAIGQNRVRRNLAHHDDAQSVVAARESVLRQQRDHLLGLSDRADKGDHDLDIGQSHVVAHALDRTALELEAIVELRRDIARGAAESEHRIFLVRLVARAADQVRVFVGLEVGQPDDDLLRRERRGNRGHAFDDLGDIELGRAVVAGCALGDLRLDFRRLRIELDKRLRMHADIFVDDELEAGEPHAFVRQPAELEGKLGVADVHHDLGRRRRHAVERDFDDIDLQ